MTALDGELEGQEVRFAQGGGVDELVYDMPSGLLVVQHEMLGRRDDVIALNAPNGLARQRPRQQRVFSEVLEITAVAGLARQVDSAREQNVESLGARKIGPGTKVQVR